MPDTETVEDAIVPAMDVDGAGEVAAEVEATDTDAGDAGQTKAEEGAAEAGKGPSQPNWDKSLARLDRTVANMMKAIEGKGVAQAQPEVIAVSSDIAAQLAEIDEALKDESDAAISPNHRKALLLMRKGIEAIARKVDAQQATAAKYQQGEAERSAWSEFDRVNSDIPDARKLFEKHAAFAKQEAPNASPEMLSHSATMLFKQEAQQIRATAKAKKAGVAAGKPNTQTGRTSGPQNASKPRPSGERFEGMSPKDLAEIGDAM